MDIKSIKPGKTYRHFKGGVYRVICLGRSCDDESIQVVYCSVDNENSIWIRNIEEFASRVDKKKYPDIKQVYRFEEV